jgi:hypothetical protein
MMRNQNDTPPDAKGVKPRVATIEKYGQECRANNEILMIPAWQQYQRVVFILEITTANLDCEGIKQHHTKNKPRTLRSTVGR